MSDIPRFNAGVVINKRDLFVGGEMMRKFPKALNRFLRKAVVETVRIVEKHAKVNAPRKTGATAAAINGKVLSNTVGIVGTNQEAAMAIDQGAKAHIIRPKTAKMLAIPRKNSKGRYTSLSKTTKSGKARTYKRRQYKDAPGAPNKRHLDVGFTFTKLVNHPGMKGTPFMTSAAKIANGVALKEGHNAAGRAMAKMKRIK